MPSDRLVPDYTPLVEACEGDARRHGVTPQGVGWPNAPDLVKRFDVMFDMVREPGPFRLLDLGCGPGLIMDYIQARGWLDRVDYVGIDASQMMIDAAKRDWPRKRFELRDILHDPFPEQSFDYVIINGVFTCRASLSHEAMERFVCAMLKAAWPSARHAMSWNVMTIHVDWQRDDLFHWPIDTAAAFSKAELSRHLVVRTDYGAWEYTMQVHRTPIEGSVAVPRRWLGDPA